MCNQSNAFIHVQNFNVNSASYNFKWKESVSGQVIGAGVNIDHLSAGTFELFATDANSCEQRIFTATVIDKPSPVLDYAQSLTKNERCSMKDGSITGLKVNNLNGPTVYTWYNQTNVVAGNNITLQNVPAGTYKLKIQDATFCHLESAPFTVVNTKEQLTPPSYDDLTIPRYSSATLKINNPSEGIFKLLPAANTGTTLQQNSSGNFTVTNITGDTSFYVKRSSGSCESIPVKVNIKVVDRSFFAIASAFTPNGDGTNDRLHVRVIGYLKLIRFRIYNKWGQLVFETMQSDNSWDGKYKGIAQNTGSFIWIAEGKDINGRLVNDRGTITLIK